MQQFTRLTLIWLALATPGIASAAARAELRPSNELAVDTPAQLTITADAENITPPRVQLAGASVRFNGQANRTMIVNGKLSHETLFNYTLTPEHVGALDIPAIRVGRDQTVPIHAEVVRDRATHAVVDTEPTRAFVRIDAPKRTLYVGEAVPVRIRAYFRAGVAATLQGNPHLTSSAFTLDGLSDKPTQKQIDINGVPYLEATWNATLSAAKPTTDKVTIELPVEISYRERRAAAAPQPRSMRDLFGADPFSDSFFSDDSMFSGSLFDEDPFAGFDSMFELGDVRQQELTLRNSAASTRIAELPEKGQPQPFSGAVGSFEVAADLPTGPLHVGEPATITFRVTGSGNFDHVALDGVPASRDWKVYPGKSVMLDDKTKAITQTIVPTHPGSLEIPSVAFNFFDPKKGTYRTVHTTAAHVDVAAAVGGGAADADLTSSSTRNADMTPNRVAASRGHSTLRPLLLQPSFWMYPGALALLMAIQLGYAWSRRSSWARERLRSRGVARRVAREQRKLVAAARAGDSPAFFDAARAAVQLTLADQWSVRPETITAADIDRRLGDDGATIRELFERADHIKYARHDMSASPETFNQWRTRIDAALKQLEVLR